VAFPKRVSDAVAALNDARTILATHESSTARIITVEQTVDRLDALAIRQKDLIRQSFRAVETGLYRAAIVLSWAAFMDYAEERLSTGRFRVVNAAYPDWKIRDVDDLRDKRPDFQIVEALHKVGLTTKGENKSLLGMLSVRNEAGHPSHLLPSINTSLGYVTDLLDRIEALQGRGFGGAKRRQRRAS
jgi:hypothetical protein